MAEKYVYYFGDGHAEGNAKMKDVLGGKGAGLAEMTNIGVPVPPGFTISTAVCTYYNDHGLTYPKELQSQVEQNLANALIHVYVIRPELRAVKIWLPNLVRLAAGQLIFAAPVRLW